MSNWDTSTPTGAQAVSSVDDNIRELKDAIQNALRGDEADGTVAVFPGNAPSSAPKYEYRGRKGSTAARPSSGQYGLYFDTSRNVLQRDNGSSWDDIGVAIPAGTVMLFVQASAPVGWTKLVTQDDKALRIVSGSTGGSAGGTLGLSGGVSHTHTVASHVHSIPEASLAHYHETTVIESDSGVLAVAGAINGVGTNATNGLAVHTFAGTGAISEPASGYQYQKTSAIKGYSTGNTSGTALTTDATAPVIAYVDVLQASKD